MWFRGTSKQEGSQTQARHEKVVRKKKKKKKLDEGSSSISKRLKTSIRGPVIQKNVIWLYELHLMALQVWYRFYVYTLQQDRKHLCVLTDRGVWCRLCFRTKFSICADDATRDPLQQFSQCASPTPCHIYLALLFWNLFQLMWELDWLFTFSHLQLPHYSQSSGSSYKTLGRRMSCLETLTRKVKNMKQMKQINVDSLMAIEGALSDSWTLAEWIGRSSCKGCPLRACRRSMATAGQESQECQSHLPASAKLQSW